MQAPTITAISRLEKFIIRNEEGEISKDQVQINDQLQKDEVLALDAIVGEVFTFPKTRGLQCFQICVHVKLPDDFTVYAKLGSFISNMNSTEGDESNGFHYTVNIRYLPPIILTCVLPLSYPSHNPPHFTMYAQWLDSEKISTLCCMLDSIWNEQPRQEVLYQWVEWLRDSSVSYLGFNDGVRYFFDEIHDTEDDRAISGIMPLENNIASMIKYNDEKNNEAFLANVHRCSICFEEYAGKNLIRLSCKHFFCFECMKSYSSIHVREGTVTNLKCPDAKCDELILPNELKRLLENEPYKRWESMVLERALDAMPDVVYCPRCQTACLEHGNNFAQCSKCYYSFCSLCNEQRHVGFNCMKFGRKLIIPKGRESFDDIKNEQKRTEQNLANEFLSLKEVLRTSRLCPSCKAAISRIDGCNKMVCRNCGKYFCYRCNKIISGYDHFENKCQLFSNEVLVNPTMMIYQEKMLANFHAPLSNQHCPNCRQISAKVNRENRIQMTCMICRNCYCVLCLKNIRKSSHPVNFCPQPPT